MKTIIRLALLVALLCAFQPSQASAQVPSGVVPHPQVPAVYFHFFWGSNYPLSTPTGQGTYITIFTSSGFISMPPGLNKSQLAHAIGGPFYLSILVKDGIIEFDENGIWRPGPNAMVVGDEEEARALQKEVEPVGSGG